jgi:hypothetical protein
MAKVKFFAVDLKSTFEALTSKDAFALYWIMETQELYKGDVLFGMGAEATAEMAGLMSAEDKRKLDTLASIEGGMHFLGVSTTDPKDGVITIDGEIITPVAGDIVIYGNKEYVCDKNGNLVELGDEGLYLTTAQAEAEYLKKADAKNTYETKADAEKKYEELDEALNLIDITDIAWGKKNANTTKYEVVSAVDGFLTNDSHNDLRVFIPKGSNYQKQNVGVTGDATKYYMTVRAWAPRADVTACRKGDYTKYDEHFKEMETIKVDAESGRPYVDFWCAIAYTEDDGATWKEYADYSTGTKYIGFTWLVEWYVGEELVESASKKITLVNDRNMFYNDKDWYIPALEAKLEETTAKLEEASAKLQEVTVQLEETTIQLEEAKASVTWGTIG